MMPTAISRLLVSSPRLSSEGIVCLRRRPVSDQTIKLGTISIDAIVGQLAAVCSTQGQCDTSPFQLTGQLIGPGLGGSVEDETLTVNPSGSYPTWIHNGLIDAIGAAVKAVARCEQVTQTSACANPMAYCPREFLLVILRTRTEFANSFSFRKHKYGH